MGKHFKIFVLLILFIYSPVYGDWEYVNSGTTEDLNAVEFRKFDCGYIVGDNGTILFSDDSGATWTARISGVTTVLNDVSIRDRLEGSPENLAYVVGDGGTILKSSDWGQNWSPVSCPTTADLYGVSIHDEHEVYVVGEMEYLLKSINAGTTWTQQPHPNAWLYSVYSHNSNKTHVCGRRINDGYCAVTEDGGENWDVVDSRPNYKWLNFERGNSFEWYLGGFEYLSRSSGGRISYTDDKGSSWNIVYQDDSISQISSISCPYTPNVYACGYDAVGNSIIMRTNNHGQTWFTLWQDTVELYGIFSENRPFVWSVGENGTILRNMDVHLPGISVVEPDGGEYWNRGDTVDIDWTSSYVVGEVKIELLRSGSLERVIDSSTEDDWHYDYVVPMDVVEDTTYQVRISSVLSPEASDVSDEYFMIGSGAYIQVTWPNGGQYLLRGNTYNITWESAGFPDSVKIWLYWEGGSKYITQETFNDGQYEWYIDAYQKLDTTYKVRVQSVRYENIDDSSDSYFAIGRQMTIAHPQPNEELFVGDTFCILWDSSGVGGDVLIEYSINDGGTWLLINNRTPDDGHYLWCVENRPTSDGIVKVDHLSYNHSNIAYSDGNFYIVQNAYLDQEKIGDWNVDEGYWELYFDDDISQNGHHDAGEPIYTVPQGHLPKEDLSCWMASAANILRYKGYIVDYEEWLRYGGVESPKVCPWEYMCWAEDGDDMMTFDDGGWQHWVLEHEGHAFASIKTDEEFTAGTWNWNPVDWCQARITEGRHVGLNVYWGVPAPGTRPGNGPRADDGYHSITLWEIDEGNGTLLITDSDNSDPEPRPVDYYHMDHDWWIVYLYPHVPVAHINYAMVYNYRPIAIIDNINPNPANRWEEVTFRGHGEDPETWVTEYSWRSSIDGHLSTSAEFTSGILSVGTHWIYFKVQDSDTSWSHEDSAELVIRPPVSVDEYQHLTIRQPFIHVFPNPCRASMHIRYSLGDNNHAAELKIFDITGRLVKEFLMQNNVHINHLYWSGTDHRGRQLPSGVYFVRFQADDFFKTEKLILFR